MDRVTPTDDPVTMLVDDAVAADGPVDEPAATEQGPRRGRVPWVLASLVLALSVGGVLVFANGSDRPDVRVLDSLTDQWSTAPPAPAGPLARRWSLPLPPDRTLVGMAVVDDRVLLASRGRLVSSDRGDHIVVAAHDTIDGEVVWRHEVDGAAPAVVVADDTSTALLTNMGLTAHPNGRYAFERSGITALSPDGAVAWRRDLAGGEGFSAGDGRVEVRPGGDLLTYDREGVAVLDPRTGEAVLEFPAVQDAGADGGVRHAWSSHGAWFVPTPTGWDVADLDGATEFSIDGPRSRPRVHDDLVVIADGSVVTARRRPGGEEAWRVDVGREVLWTSDRDTTAPGADHGSAVTDPSGDSPGQIVAWVEHPDVSTTSGTEVVIEGDGSASSVTGLLIEDGRLVGKTDEEATGTRPAGWSPLVVEIDGTTRTVCRRLASDFTGTDSDCPDELAIRGPDGEVVATADRVQHADLHPSLTWRATDAGLLTIERDAIRLSGWEDLTESWSIPIDQAPTRSRPATVATTATGVAVASNEAGPAQVTWYR